MNNFNFRLRPDGASNFVFQHDLLFGILTALTVLFTVIVAVMILFFALKYRRGTKADRSNPMYESHKLEMLWIVVPTALALAVFAYSSAIFIEMRTPPKNATEVFVIGKQWMWHMQHPNGIKENNELHVPLGKPVKVTMISQDVIHGFYLPEMRVQYQVVPGRYTQLWFTPTKPGRYHIFCTIHCGTQHSEMGGYLYVLPPNEFAKWSANGGNRFKQIPQTLADQGKRHFEELACGTCHGPADNERGPSLMGIFGKPRQMTDGSVKVADEDYIRQSIINPYALINKGYDQTMPVYQLKSQVTEEQIRAMIEYIKTLGVPAAPPASSAATQPAKEDK
jgi:cytochrome c oxidase subunit 2